MRCNNCGQNNDPKARFCASCGVPLTTMSMPGVGSSYGNAWRQMWKHFWILLLVGIVYVVISSVSSSFTYISNNASAAGVSGVFSLVYSILLVNPLGYGVAFAFLKAARGDKVEFGDMFTVFHNYWKAVLASFLVGIFVIIGTALLIVPGIIVACKLAFTPYLVVDRNMAAMEAIRESWRMTGGHSWKVFLIGLLGIPIGIAGSICFGVGIVIAIIWIYLAIASLYHAVSKSGAAPDWQGVQEVPGTPDINKESI